jgi:hypothetical protein
MQLQSSRVDHKEIDRYVDQRRQQVDSFIADHFSCRGTLLVFWRTLKTDVVRHPINFVLSIPFLFVGKAANWLEKLGWYAAAKILNRVPLRLRTGFENAREQQVVVGLLGLSDERKELRDVLATQINAFMATRAAILDLASGGLTIAVAYSFFGSATLSPYEMAQQLATSSAREEAASNFALGRGIGSAFYHLFPPQPTVFQILTSSGLMFLLLGALTALLNVFSDPVQKSLGILRRQLNRLLDGCEESLFLDAVKRQREGEPGRSIGANTDRGSTPHSTAVPEDLLLPPRSVDLGSSQKEGVSLPKQMTRRIVALASLIRGGFGRAPILLGGLGISAVVALIGLWVYQRLDPYLEVQRLIERKAFVTAVARLDQLPKSARAREGEGEYWYWRGRALMGNKQLDAGIEAYRSATLKAARYRKDSALVRDATDAVASKDHEKAKQLLLEQIGPAAIKPLLEKALTNEDIHRWSLVELIKKLGGEDQVNYREIAIIDLAVATTCQGKRRALEKISKYSAKAAIPTLRQLDGQPQFKCLQNVLKPAIAKLEATQ